MSVSSGICDCHRSDNNSESDLHFHCGCHPIQWDATGKWWGGSIFSILKPKPNEPKCIPFWKYSLAFQYRLDRNDNAFFTHSRLTANSSQCYASDLISKWLHANRRQCSFSFSFLPLPLQHFQRKLQTKRLLFPVFDTYAYISYQ